MRGEPNELVDDGDLPTVIFVTDHSQAVHPPPPAPSRVLRWLAAVIAGALFVVSANAVRWRPAHHAPPEFLPTEKPVVVAPVAPTASSAPTVEIAHRASKTPEPKARHRATRPASVRREADARADVLRDALAP